MSKTICERNSSSGQYTINLLMKRMLVCEWMVNFGDGETKDENANGLCKSIEAHLILLGIDRVYNAQSTRPQDSL